MIHLVTGGSASGKSAWAEQQILELDGHYNRFYIATMKPWDNETAVKIKRHQEMRHHKRFTTIECYTGLEQLQLPDSKTGEPAVVLLECMSNLTANERYDYGGSRSEICDRIMAGICHLQKQARHIMIVTNEVFSDGSMYSAETLEYLKLLGLVNCELGQKARRITEVVYGIPITLKNG
ncbi:MAG: bifunctional adenosylcobinamide kinase/adenosylcobinamide-phosphate guanylyltransferase [Lachnospiraceae bacterium]